MLLDEEREKSFEIYMYFISSSVIVDLSRWFWFCWFGNNTNVTNIICIRKRRDYESVYLRSSGFIEVAPTNTASLTSTISSRSAHNACSFIPFAPSLWTPTPRAGFSLDFDLSFVTIRFFHNDFILGLILSVNCIYYRELVSMEMGINLNYLSICWEVLKFVKNCMRACAIFKSIW